MAESLYEKTWIPNENKNLHTIIVAQEFNAGITRENLHKLSRMTTNQGQFVDIHQIRILKFAKQILITSEEQIFNNYFNGRW